MNDYISLLEFALKKNNFSIKLSNKVWHVYETNQPTNQPKVFSQAIIAYKWLSLVTWNSWEKLTFYCCQFLF